MPTGTQLVFTGLTLEFATGEPIVLNNTSETQYTNNIKLTNQSDTLIIKAGEVSESSFVVSSVKVDIVSTNLNAPIESVRRTQVSGSNFLADLQGSGMYNVWKSKTLKPALYTGPVNKTQLTEGESVILDSEITGDSAFYIILSSDKTP